MSYPSLVGRSHCGGIGLEGFGYVAVTAARCECLFAEALFLTATFGKLAVGQFYIDSTSRNIDGDYIAVAHQTYRSTGRRFRRYVAYYW